MDLNKPTIIIRDGEKRGFKKPYTKTSPPIKTNLSASGFETGFTSIYWTYASGFPKASNIGKMVDKKPYRKERLQLKQYLKEAIKKSGKTKKQIDAECGFTACSYIRVSFRDDDGWGEALPDIQKWFKMKKVIGFDDAWDWLVKENERQLMGKHKSGIGKAFTKDGWGTGRDEVKDTLGKSELEGSYGGFQPKPAVEIILVCMKPLSEKTYVDQALKNKKGITWLDDCRVPYESSKDKEGARFGTQMDIRGGNLKTPIGIKDKNVLSSPQGRFPANLLVSDDVLNDGKVTKSTKDRKSYKGLKGTSLFVDEQVDRIQRGDSGSYSRYFDLDKWAEKMFPFLIVPKASKREKNRGLGKLKEKVAGSMVANEGKTMDLGGASLKGEHKQVQAKKNFHPTVKPVKLMFYLVTLGSRPNDTVLDPFMGVGTTGAACRKMNRRFTGIEIDKTYFEIAEKRITNTQKTFL